MKLYFVISLLMREYRKIIFFLAEIGTNGSICIVKAISSLGNDLKVKQIFTIYLLATSILDDFDFQYDHS